MDYISDDHKLCELDNQIFEIMSAGTRREILRLISCEHNYGNQLAKILDVSNPTIHRHLQKLVEDEILQEKERTSESFSGYRGGEAVLYNIAKGVFLNLTILPHLVHAHVIEADKQGEIIKPNPTKKIQFRPNTQTKNSKVREFVEIADLSQVLNQEIIDLEKQLAQKLFEKNKVMEQLDGLLNQSKLNFANRIVLRAIACLGPGCHNDIAKILGKDPLIVDHHLQNLSEQGWLEAIRD